MFLANDVIQRNNYLRKKNKGHVSYSFDSEFLKIIPKAVWHIMLIERNSGEYKGPSRDDVQGHLEKLIKVWTDKGFFTPKESRDLI